jgi:hypothetical protein
MKRAAKLTTKIRSNRRKAKLKTTTGGTARERSQRWGG